MHPKIAKHNKKLPKSTSSIRKFTSKKAETSNAEPVTEDTSKSKKQSTITDFGIKTHTQNAEIFWALDVVLSGYSFNSCQNKNDLFCNMFPDSNIAKNFACGKTKCSYIVTYGLAPYFKSLLNDTLSSLDCFVAMFDESYNKISKRGQMDLHVRFWDIENNCDATRNFNSKFLGKAAAQDIYEKFNECISELDENKLLQVSSDGPNVNLAFLDLLKEHRSDNELSCLIHIGSCGLHTIHNSMKHGENSSGWKLKKLLQSMYKLFEEATKRCEKYEEITLKLLLRYGLDW